MRLLIKKLDSNIEGGIEEFWMGILEKELSEIEIQPCGQCEDGWKDDKPCPWCKRKVATFATEFKL